MTAIRFMVLINDDQILQIIIKWLQTMYKNRRKKLNKLHDSRGFTEESITVEN